MSEPTFGQKLREARKKANISQRELQQLVNLDFTYISKLENDRMPPPSARAIEKIAKALDANMIELAYFAKKPIALLRAQLEHERQQAANWENTAREFSRNSDYWKNRAHYAEELVRELLNAMDRWGADEDGIPEEAVAIWAEANTLIDRAFPKEQE